MYSPSQLHAYYREHFATQGFPALFMGKTFAVYHIEILFMIICNELMIEFLAQTNNPSELCHCTSHSQMGHYFFSYLLTCEVNLIKVLEISAQMLQYVTLSLKTINMSSDFTLNYLKKVVGGATTQKYQKQMLKR